MDECARRPSAHLLLALCDFLELPSRPSRPKRRHCQGNSFHDLPIASKRSLAFAGSPMAHFAKASHWCERIRLMPVAGDARSLIRMLPSR